MATRQRPRSISVPADMRRVQRGDGTSPPPFPFADVACAVDGSRGAAEAVRQTVALCGPGASIDIVAVSNAFGTGLSAQADLGVKRARTALDEAARTALQAGARASTDLRHGGVSDCLLDASAGRDLLAIGCHGGSRLGGIMLGSTATQLAHRAELPLLIARGAGGDGDRFPRRILLASDGSSGSLGAMRVAAALTRAHGATLDVVFVPDGHPERYRELFRQVTAIERLTGTAPDFTDEPGDPARQISDTARVRSASLVVIGKRGLRGIKALGSVSERLVHRAPCSVLVVPPPVLTPAD